MKPNQIIFFTFLLLIVGFLTFRFSLSYFSDSGQSTNNILAASAVFPTSAPNAGDIVINEINWAGNNNKSEDEWIELRNMTSRSIDLTNWKIENLGGGSTSIISISGTIPPNGYFLIAKFDETESNSRLNVHPDISHPTPDINLNNDGELLILKTETDSIIDSAGRNPPPDGWFAGFNGNNSNPTKSMERKNPPGDGTVSTNWQNATTHTNLDAGAIEFGSPKAENGT